MKCSICEKEIPVKEGGWSQGNNAQPVNDGRCCDDCNMNVVVPARMREMLGRNEVEDWPEHWLYLLNHGGVARVVGEDDNWTTAHQLTGETGRLFATAPELLACLKDCVEWLESVPGGLGDSALNSVREAKKVIAKVKGGE
jgi:hypothetical protein